MHPDSGRIHKYLITISSGHLYLDNDAAWLLALHPVTPTELVSILVAQAKRSLNC